MTDSPDLNFGIKESARMQFPEWKEIVVGRYFGSAETQIQMIKRAGIKPLELFKDLLREARVHAEASVPQTRLQLVKVQLHEIGLYYPCLIYDIQSAMQDYDLMAYVHEFVTWLWLSYPDALAEGDDFYGFSQPAQLQAGDYIPRMRMKKGKRFLLATDVFSQEFKPEDTFIAVQWTPSF